MRDIISLFADRASLDELGIGTIRDALSDMLFPGTSTLLTRARYLLFVPWCYQLAGAGKDAADRADKHERTLITALGATEDSAGLLGKRAGETLANLPSAIYWGALARYGILTERSAFRSHALPSLGQERLAPWHPTLPPVPQGFPKTVEDGFALSRGEAEWLRERILAKAPGTLMAHLVTYEPDRGSTAFWRDTAALSVPGDARLIVDHARSFTLAIRGASLIYNLLLSEAYERAGLIKVHNPIERYRRDLEDWSQTADVELDLETWDLNDLFMRVQMERDAPVHASSASFVSAWVDLLRRSDLATLADNEEARAVVARRERLHKGSHSRLGNARKLATWGGASGANEIGYRWNAARRILLDIHEGLRRDA